MDRRDALRALCAAPAIALLPAGKAPAAGEDETERVLEPHVQPPPCTDLHGDGCIAKTWEPAFNVKGHESHSAPEHLVPTEPSGFRKRLSLLIRKECVERGWPLEKFADRAYWNRSEIRGFIEGRHDVSCNFLPRIGAAFGHEDQWGLACRAMREVE